jgi:hypothetical protein
MLSFHDQRLPPGVAAGLRALLALLLALSINQPSASVADSPDGVARSPAPADIEPERLPDGYFSGPFFIAPEGGGAAIATGYLRIQIVHGFIVSAVALADTGDGEIALRPMTAPDDPELRMNGRAGRGFIKIRGEFWDARAAMGVMDGVVGDKKARGFWSVTRR